MKKEQFPRDKVAVIRRAATTLRFNVDQLLKVMNVLSFPVDKIEAAVLVYPRLVDEDQFRRVYAALPFDTNRVELARRIKALSP